jgi:phosphatidylglycerophosphatase A
MNADNPLPTPNLRQRSILALATGFGLGMIPFAPGTFGSLLGLPLAWGIEQLPFWARMAMPIILFAVGVPICAAGARILRLKDPGPVVFDEIAAFSVVFLAAPFNWKTALSGFLLFRIFDITKPWPARRLEHLPGGVGIMADDYAAGAYAAVLLWLLNRWLGLS